MNDDKSEAIAKVIVGLPFSALTAVALVYLASLSWLSAGVIGVAIAGVVLGVACVGPYLVASGVREYREVTEI